MDNRWRFLYHIWTELWGHRQGMGAGNGEPGASEVGVPLEKPRCNLKTLSGPNISREAQAPGCQEKPL